MIIRNVRVENWRSLTQPLSVELDDALTVLHGSNGQGKSTLVEAIRMGFFDRHGTTGEEVKKIRSWGRDLTPRVQVEFEHDGSRYRLTKQFLANKLALVERDSGGGAWERFTDGDAADDWLRGLFSGDAPGRGLAKLEHLGLARVLWIPQGVLDYGGISESLQSVLAHGGGEERCLRGGGNLIESRARARFLQFFTDKGRERSTDGSIAELQEQLDAQRGLMAQVQEHLARMSTLARTVEDARLQIEEYGRQIRSIRAALGDMAQTNARYQADRLALEKSRTRRAELEGARDALEARCNGLREALENVSTGQKKHTTLTDAVALAEQQLRAAESRVSEAQIAIGRLQAQETTIATERKRVLHARRYNEGATRLGELQRTDDAVRKLERRIGELNERIGAVRAPGKKEISTLRSALAALHEAEVELRASSLKFEFTAQNDTGVVTVSGEPAFDGIVASGDTLVVQGVGAIQAELKQVGRISITGPVSDSAEALQKKIAKHRATVEKFGQEYGSANPDILQDRFQSAQALGAELESCREQLASLLGDRTRDDIPKEIAAVKALLAEIEREQAGWDARPPDEHALAAAADDLERKFKATWEGAIRSVTQASAERDHLSERLGSCRRELDETQEAIERWARRAGDLGAGRGLDELTRELQALLGELHVADMAFAAAQQTMSSYAGDPAQEQGDLERRLESLTDLERQLGERRSAGAAELNALGGMGVYSQAAELEESVAALESRIGGLQMQAGGIRLLWNTLQVVKQELRTRVSSPVEARAGQLFHQINGCCDGSIKFDERFKVDGFIPAAGDPGEALDPSNLSGGEREQLYLAIRLALAERLAPQGSGRHLVVLDDFLTATDDARLARIKALVETMLDRFQFLILTCHPERYMGMARGTTIGI